MRSRCLIPEPFEHIWVVGKIRKICHVALNVNHLTTGTGIYEHQENFSKQSANVFRAFELYFQRSMPGYQALLTPTEN